MRHVADEGYEMIKRVCEVTGVLQKCDITSVSLFKYDDAFRVVKIMMDCDALVGLGSITVLPSRWI